MRATAEQFDLVIIGGGPGGYAAALYGASAGMRIAMVEEQRVGGTCLHRGCIPAKELLETATVVRTVRGAQEFGVEVNGVDSLAINFDATQKRKHQVIDRLTSGLETLLKGRKVTVVPGTAKLLDGSGRLVAVSDGTELRGTNVLIATGSLPRALPLPGLDFDGDRVLSSDHVLELTSAPWRVAVIGGGAIGCEFASYLRDVGSEVTILEALPQLLTGVDAQVAQTVVRSFKKRGIEAIVGAKISGADTSGDAVGLRYQDKKGDATLEVDTVIVSIGRRPRSEGINLLEEGVAVDARGFVTVDRMMRTNMSGIYAVGDVVDSPQLAHVAFAEAIVAIRDMLGEAPAPVDYTKVPWGIYCHPEVAFCGLTEERAKEAGYEVETSSHRFIGNGRALIVGEPDGLVKIVAEKGTGVLLGVHICGPWATELIAEGYLSVNWEATANDIGALIHAHPTLSELFGESALALTGRSLHG